MRAIVLRRRGGRLDLRIEDRPEPRAAAGRTLIDVRACGVNFADLMARAGLHPDTPPPPVVLGLEVAGVVADSGRRVLAPVRFGGYAEQVVVPDDDVVPMPPSLSFAQACAVPVAYSTAWAALVRYAHVEPGERVVVLGAGGGVGLAAVQLARSMDAYVIAVCSPRKHAAVRAHGADEVHDDDPRGLAPVDVVLDGIGGSSVRRSYAMLGAGGRLVVYGASSLVVNGRRRLPRTAAQAMIMIRGFDLVQQIGDARSVLGLNMLRLWDAAGSLAPWLDPVCRLIAEGTLAPVVDEEFSFDRFADAHRRLAERRNLGKVVLAVDGTA